MKIGIREIPEEGLNIHWTNEDLKFDHVKSLQVTGFILPISGGFDVSGTLEAQVPMDCSFCANSLPIPIQEKFHEVLLLGKKKPTSKKTEDGEEVIEPSDVDEFYIDGPDIDLSNMIRDTIETALPIQPKCVERGAPQNYPKCAADWDYESYINQHSGTPLVNPFEALKNLKNLKKN